MQQNPEAGTSPPKATLWRLPWLAIGLLLLVALQWFMERADVDILPYSDFLRELEDGHVAQLRVYPDRLEGTLNRPLPDGRTRFTTVRVDPALAHELQAHPVQFTGVVESGLLGNLLAAVLPALVFAVVWLALMRHGAGGQGIGGGILTIGKSTARMFGQTPVKVTFADVAGADEAKAELEEVVDFLRNPAAHERLGARMPKGILLVGPPGTGKTLLARAAAGQAGVPFYSINGSEFVELFVGVGAARVRDLFDQARRSAPCIVFIDEIDALGRARGAWTLGGQDEKEQTLNQLLAEMDGFNAGSGVVLLAATNRPEILDPALLRAGRFDRQVLIDRPDRRGRTQILGVHAKRVRLAAGLDLEQIAALTPGFTGADLANLVNEAALHATRRSGDAVEAFDFTAAIERIVAGLERRNRILNDHERHVIAVHEMGHVIVGHVLGNTEKIHKVSIIPRGIAALGYTLQRPTEDRFLMTRAELQSRLSMLLGGRAAEVLMLDEVSTGAEDDLARATDIARSMVMRFGMDSDLGPVAYEPAPSALLPVPESIASAPPRRFSEATSRDIDCAVQRLIQDALGRASDVLQKNKALLEEGSRRLLASETLEEAQLAQLFNGPSAPAASWSAAPFSRHRP